MNVSLTRELEEFVDAKVESGLYNNASEVVREGRCLLKERDELRVRVRESIERGCAQALAGDLIDGPAAIAALRQGVKDRAKKRA